MKMISLLLVAIIIIGCRSYSIKAQNKLSIEDKAKLLDYGSKGGNFMPLLVLCVGLIPIIFFAKTSSGFIAFIISAALGVSILLTGLVLVLYKNLKPLGLPKEYVKTSLISNTIIYVAVITYIFTL